MSFDLVMVFERLLVAATDGEDFFVNSRIGESKRWSWLNEEVKSKIHLDTILLLPFAQV